MAGSGYVRSQALGAYQLWNDGRALLGDLDVELTERCDNACVHCCINLARNDRRAQSRELDTASWKEVLRQAANLGAIAVRFTGGEPLLRTDFPELYIFSRQLGMKVIVFTNARRVTPELADLFARTPPLRPVEVSVYGMSQTSYESVSRTPNSYLEFKAGLELLLKRKVPVLVKMPLLPQNRHEVQSFIKWGSSLPRARGRTPPTLFALELRHRRDSQARDKQIAALRWSPKEFLALEHKLGATGHIARTQHWRDRMHPPGDRLFLCGAGLKNAAVDAYGYLQPCLLLRDPGLASDLKSIPLREALLPLRKRLLSLRATNPTYLERCAQCFIKGLCDQCPGKSWTETGTLDTPVEYLCQLAHARARELGLLAADESSWEIRDWQKRLEKMQ
ncbi:MAG: radical SAM protein [candidate division WOR-3 bacterium]